MEVHGNSHLQKTKVSQVVLTFCSLAQNCSNIFVLLLDSFFLFRGVFQVSVIVAFKPPFQHVQVPLEFILSHETGGENFVLLKKISLVRFVLKSLQRFVLLFFDKIGFQVSVTASMFN
tara:strand:- start:630 stop:983 length:354 start_codon:yes stop_codon:yes gene_type:complete